MDHGSQYLSDRFLNQVRYWGIRPSFGLLEEPETNGVVERWNRTLTEQAVYGRVFRNLADVGIAMREPIAPNIRGVVSTLAPAQPDISGRPDALASAGCVEGLPLFIVSGSGIGARHFLRRGRKKTH